MKSLFDPVSFGPLRLKNRIVRSATMAGATLAEKGAIWAELAAGGSGLVITGMMGVIENSCVGERMTQGYRPGVLEAHKPFFEAVQRHGAKIAVQLGHCGLKANFLDGGQRPLGPSVVRLPNQEAPLAMRHEQIAQVVAAFAKTARSCKEAGADAVQLHAAHGYLLSQFLSPFFNHRLDEYGGNIDNRGRIVLEIVEAIRGQVGPDYPVLIKVNYSDLAEPSITFEECASLCSQLAKHGLTAVELSAGLGNDALTSPIRRVKKPGEEGYFAEPALDLADMLSIPVISVGGYRDIEAMEKRLNQGQIEAFAMSRPLICEPALAARWQSGDRVRARCVSCNRCFSPKGAFGCKYPFPA
ncbi:MAG: NADH:flavin oxidoreductase [Deltaproteobacteria bacterium]|jgi:2,4-dienoyl-CoA reductase-like NADH-dependent reductase (Old Yellow Enzyme family)|nr:NADH:flavin oxidoreductase [Deltaproteobacteria bacterium]